MSASIRQRWAVALGSTAALACVSFALAFGLGTRHVDLVSALDTHLSHNSARALLLEARLPRVVLSAIAGAGLATVGATLQALLRNVLADPFVLGTSGGAALGATAALVLGVPAAFAPFALPLFAFVGALGAILVVWRIARARPDHDASSVLLAGIIVNTFASALITLVKVLVTATQAQEVLFWLVGAVGYESWSAIATVGVAVLVGVVLLTALSAKLNVLSLGDEAASGLGVDVARLRGMIFVVTSLMVGAIVSFVGLIGFVGLVVPHGVRLVFGADHRVTVPASAFVGAAFLCISDLIARLCQNLIGTEPPVGAVTALIGCPLFLWLLLARRATAT